MTTVRGPLGTSPFDALPWHLHPTGEFTGPHELHHWWEPGVLHVAGEVDCRTARTFREVLVACDTDPCIQALDLTEVGFFSAAGVKCFVEEAWTLRPHAAIIASPAVRRVLTLCDMEYLLGRHGWREAYDGWWVRRFPAF